HHSITLAEFSQKLRHISYNSVCTHEAWEVAHLPWERRHPAGSSYARFARAVNSKEPTGCQRSRFFGILRSYCYFVNILPEIADCRRVVDDLFSGSRSKDGSQWDCSPPERRRITLNERILGPSGNPTPHCVDNKRDHPQLLGLRPQHRADQLDDINP